MSITKKKTLIKENQELEKTIEEITDENQKLEIANIENEKVIKKLKKELEKEVDNRIDREYLINSILWCKNLLVETQMTSKNNDVLNTIQEMRELVEKLQTMSCDELRNYRQDLAYKIDAEVFKSHVDYMEKIMMNSIYQEHGELINKILYGSETGLGWDKAEQVILTIRCKSGQIQFKFSEQPVAITQSYLKDGKIQVKPLYIDIEKSKEKVKTLEKLDRKEGIR